ncbi:hypothetical protein PIB30_003575 [Stylosanthes scabra]|uniref:Uncharacterized protein n=1 Tax=Stylosanthes scabra TaxID=79078 RepID=A0ABU6X2C6_9FABA|nr:hypothetical protein [Stylosanthes scabra]
MSGIAAEEDLLLRIDLCQEVVHLKGNLLSKIGQTTSSVIVIRISKQRQVFMRGNYIYAINHFPFAAARNSCPHLVLINQGGSGPPASVMA